jgi:hypothetical protein
VFRCVLGSEGCVLVPRFSSTPVATWTWPIWVVSRRRVLEVVFILLESSSPWRRNFISSHSLPPSLVHRIGPSKYHSHATCITLYPLACIQKGIDHLDVIPRMCASLTVGFITDSRTLNASKFLTPLTSFVICEAIIPDRWPIVTVISRTPID